MISLRARIVLGLLEHRHWLRLQRRPVIDAQTDIPALRRRAERSAARFGRPGPGIRVLPLTLGGIPAEWLRCGPTPADPAGEPVLLYFHGGGYVMGSCASHRGVVAKFVAGSGIAALLFEYRLAPEHPFPAALDDALAAYQALLDRGQTPGRIVFIGDSAGGGLCLATLLALRDRGRPLPAAAVVMSPWTDLPGTGASYARADPLAPAGAWQTFGRHYAGTQDPALPLISPLYGELHGLPPLLILAGEDEAMRDDAVRFAHKAQAAGVAVRLQVAEGMVHCYPVMAGLFPEASVALQDICGFLRQHAGLDADGPAA